MPYLHCHTEAQVISSSRQAASQQGHQPANKATKLIPIVHSFTPRKINSLPALQGRAAHVAIKKPSSAALPFPRTQATVHRKKLAAYTTYMWNIYKYITDMGLSNYAAARIILPTKLNLIH